MSFIKQHLLGHPGGSRMRNRVVGMKDVQAVLPRDLPYLDGQGQRVRRVLEQRVVRDLHLVEDTPGRGTS